MTKSTILGLYRLNKNIVINYNEKYKWIYRNIWNIWKKIIDKFQIFAIINYIRQIYRHKQMYGNKYVEMNISKRFYWNEIMTQTYRYIYRCKYIETNMSQIYEIKKCENNYLKIYLTKWNNGTNLSIHTYRYNWPNT